MNKSNKKPRVLVDLKIAMNNGYCGIAKENRLVFKMLAQAQSLQAEGLLVSANPNSVFTRYKQLDAQAAIEQANRFFHEALNHELKLKSRWLKGLRLHKLYALTKNKFSLYTLNQVFRDVIWRKVFDKSLGAEDRALLESPFLYTDLTALHVGVSAYFKRKVELTTSGYDFAIFLEPTPLSVTPGTTKIVRYHDAIPITEPDFSGSIYAYGTINTLNHCAKDSYFVCNSEPTREALLAIRPELEAKACTIPCAMTSAYKKVNNTETLKQILVSRFSSTVVKPEFLAALRKQILAATSFDYIFNLATFDPKKNHASLIKAWEKLNYQNPKPVKLVMAANRGWFSQETKDLMRPHIEMGNLIHVENLSVDDLPYLFSHAKAFVFPSYAEGFGLPPLEAMQCECPTIVSDIPAHRWVLGDASLYCDPYDSDSLTEALARLVYKPGAEDLGRGLAQKGLERVRLYSEESLSGQWVELFERLRQQGL